jgi:hypothetical protein
VLVREHAPAGEAQERLALGAEHDDLATGRHVQDEIDLPARGVCRQTRDGGPEGERGDARCEAAGR